MGSTSGEQDTTPQDSRARQAGLAGGLIWFIWFVLLIWLVQFN